MASKLLLNIGLFALYIGLVSCDRQIRFRNDVQPIFLEHGSSLEIV